MLFLVKKKDMYHVERILNFVYRLLIQSNLY